jgi:hypothetical protein
MSLVDIAILDDTSSDIHATRVFLNPLAGRSHPGDAMAIVTCVTTPPESLDHTVNYLWHLLKGSSRPMRVSSRHSSAPYAVAAHTVSSKPPLRSTAPRGRGESGITDDNRHSVPAGVNGRGCAASLRGPVAAARYATVPTGPAGVGGSSSSSGRSIRATGRGGRNSGHPAAPGDLGSGLECLLLLPPERLTSRVTVGGVGVQEGSQKSRVCNPTGTLHTAEELVARGCELVRAKCGKMDI